MSNPLPKSSEEAMDVLAAYLLSVQAPVEVIYAAGILSGLIEHISEVNSEG